MFSLSDSIHNTRSNDLNLICLHLICLHLICPKYRATIFHNSFFYFGPQLWNTWPILIKVIVISGNIAKFKKKIKKKHNFITKFILINVNRMINFMIVLIWIDELL